MSDAHREAEWAAELMGRIEECPSADALQGFHDGSMDSVEADSVREHLHRCEACAQAIRFLASGAGEPPAAEEQAVPDDVLARSERLVGAVARRRQVSRAALVFRVAAAIAFVSALGVGGYHWLRRPGEEGLGELRGAAPLDPVAPMGTVSSLPAEIRWTAHPQAASYRVALFDANLDEIWSGRTGGREPALELDAAARGALAAGGRFTWQVEALDPLGGPVAHSPAAHFEIARGAPTGR